MEKIVKVESEMGKKLTKAAQDALLNDLRGQFVHHGKVMIQEKMQLQEGIRKAENRIKLLDARIEAIEAGRVEFDMLKGQLIFPTELTDAGWNLIKVDKDGRILST
jgi:hypothetical protein